MSLPENPAVVSSAISSPAPSRLWLMLSLMVAMVLAALDQSIVATALPRIAREMDGLEAMSWVVTIFLLTSTISTPLYGKLSDLYGQRRLFLISIGVFVGASALCGLASSMGQLIAFRGLQGLGAGGLMTLSQIVLGRAVEPSQRGRYQGLFSAAFAISSAAGPLLGGFITAHFTWRWVFYINVPLGALAMLGLMLNVPALARQARAAIDYKGALVLCVATSALLLLTHASSLAQQLGNAVMVLLGVIAFVGFGLLYRIERRAEEPIIDPALFANRRYSVAVAAMAGMSFAMMGSLVFMPLYFQAVLHQTPTESGFMTLPQVAMLLISSLIGGWLSSKRQNFVQLLVAGVALECLGLTLLLVWAHLQMGAAYFFVTMGVLGIGMGIGMPNATVIVQNSVPTAVMGAATAGMSFCRSLGGALGVAAAGGIMSFTLNRELALLPEQFQHINLLEGLGEVSGSPTQMAQLTELYRGAIEASLGTGGVVMFVALLLTIGLLRAKPASATAHR
ncbi:DHA2 family efflux MFS transporter permease subunit [Pseudomonas baltica]|uniref:DHA2 family efflux MFS transporter permease subunit n=1 Tax=Pseudomonas baltica TaxID=2762576 RepID=UPI00289CFFF6|nr:DHA2 family efflux MFS transporter permease subunit [Pseudomonas baltica]